MNSRLIRILLVVIGIAIGLTAGYFLNNIDNELSAQRLSANALRDQAAALSSTIADVRAGQFAYVGRGQGEAFWISHVEGLMPVLQNRAAEFGASLTSPQSKSTFETAAAALANFQTLDAKVKDYVKSGNSLLAADMIFSDGLESTTAASTQVAAALAEELQHRSTAMASLRNRELALVGGGAGALFLLMVALALAGPPASKPAEPEVTATPTIEPVRFEAPLPKARAAVTPKLVTTARLCGELARVAEGNQLPGLLERAARVLDASGIIVWVAEPMRQALVPALSHGYADKAVARMGNIHRDANNAVAHAFRSSEVRTVAGDAFARGAIIVPLMTSDGCVGALSAEMKAGAEKDESCLALATIFASQLATIVATPAALPAKAAAQG